MAKPGSEELPGDSGGIDRAIEMARKDFPGIKDHEICIDITPGQKPFSVAAAVRTLNSEVMMLYVTNYEYVKVYDAVVQLAKSSAEDDLLGGCGLRQLWTLRAVENESTKLATTVSRRRICVMANSNASDRAFAELYELFSKPSKTQQKAFRTYLLSFENGEPIFTLSEADQILEGIFKELFGSRSD